MRRPRFMRRRQPVQELIGQVKRIYRVIGSWWSNLRSAEISRDWTEPDAAFWDKARRGLARGMELSGLFLKPLGSKVTSWVLGQTPNWLVESPRGKEVLNEWWTAHHPDILRAMEEAVDLGNCWVVINSDLSVTVLPPTVVTPIVDDNDYSMVIGWRVTERHPHPERPGDEMTIIDEYTASERVQRKLRNGALVSEQRYRNLIGRLPIVHIPNARGANEVFGRPEGDAMLTLLHWYQEVLVAALEGNKHQGRPTPVVNFETLEQLNKFFEANGSTMTQTLPDGTTEQTTVIDFDSDRLMALAGGTFQYAQPGSFAADTVRLLEMLYYLFLEHAEIPEFVMGTAIASSKASAETQMPVFVRWIEKRRGDCMQWLTEIAQIVLAYHSLFERGVNASDVPVLQWPELTGEDGQLTLQAVQWAHSEGLLDDETALGLMPFDVENSAEVLKKAQQERDERQARAEDLFRPGGADDDDEANESPNGADDNDLEAAA